MKNWFTNFKSVKNGKAGLIKYINYLENENHRNHTGDHRIIAVDINNLQTEDIILNMFNAADKKDIQNKRAGRGGRPATKFGQSIVFALPYGDFEEKLLIEFSRKLILRFYKEIARNEKIEVDKNTYAEYVKKCFANIHTKQEGSKTQVNLVLSEFFAENIKLDLSKKKYSNMFKILSTDLTKEMLNLDINKHIVKDVNAKIRKKSVNVNTFNYFKKLKELEAKEEQLKAIISKQMKIFNNIEKLEVKYKKLVAEKDLKAASGVLKDIKLYKEEAAKFEKSPDDLKIDLSSVHNALNELNKKKDKEEEKDMHNTNNNAPMRLKL